MLAVGGEPPKVLRYLPKLFPGLDSLRLDLSEASKRKQNEMEFDLEKARAKLMQLREREAAAEQEKATLGELSEDDPRPAKQVTLPA